MRSPRRIDGYAPIGDYALIGNRHTAALVGLDGSIDWLCLPRFDEPALFSALLDAGGGGHFAIAPAAPFEAERRYIDGTNVLETTFATADGVLRVTDAMSIGEGRPVAWTEIVRRVECVSGRVPLAWVVAPRFEFGRARGEVRRRERSVTIAHGKLVLGIHAWELGEPAVEDGALTGACVLEDGRSGMLVMTSFTAGPLLVPGREMVEQRIETTKHFWRRWSDGARYDGRWRAAVVRSILALELLVHQPGSAMIAAPTTSLPERIGGSRNFDYRFAWVRDTTFALDALLRLGYPDAVEAALAWMLQSARGTHPRVHTFYDLDGGVMDASRELDLPGYRGSRPVRVGNSAGPQLQLGNFGDLLQTTWLFVRDGNGLTPQAGRQLAETVDLLGELWRNRDSSIWELDDQRDYTQAKLMCWLAFDRALKLAERGEMPGDHAPRWRSERDAIRDFVQARCFDERRGAWKRDAESDDLDASVLLVAGMDFVARDDPRLHGTIDAIRRELGHGPLLYRYSGMEDEEGCFLACSFWLAEALARSDRLDEAGELMEALVSLANDVGLYAEEMDPHTGEMLGNFPQGLTHLSLLNAAFAIEEAERRLR